ncbi:MAG: phage baseplate protein [Gammaproteobacteria bacterium]|nr:MAG: phage baseplate protein [Gammaproteobacteria bacterium]
MIVARAVVRNVDDTNGLQILQVEILKGEIKNLERMQNYGFTGVPLVTSESVVLFPNGSRDHGIIVAVDDRRYRLRGLEGGEVAIYTDEGDYIILKRGNNIEMNTKTFKVNASEKIELNSPVVEASGTVADRSGTMDQMRGVYNLHSHAGLGATAPATQMLVVEE